MAEIKCRHRNVPVVVEPPSTRTDANDHNNSTVIHHDQHQWMNDVVRQLATSEPPADMAQHNKPKAIGMISSSFESQIYDLRALTNYTFEVRVARFTGEPVGSSLGEAPAPKRGSPLSPSPTRGRSQQPRPAARRLDLAPTSGGSLNELARPPSSSSLAKADGGHWRLSLAETKPFQAEALKCLANSSEVLINTGRYFGGRISVESQPFDSRCQLVGNKSSSQTSYLFRIDHEICRSKIIDSNRIETMILVHENKDIITHNTARFLVQCNVMQKSFTVKASVSLPKVNGLSQQQQAGARQAQSRPAVITSLSGRPTARDEQQVRLGSMPGIYRLIRAYAGHEHAEDERYVSGMDRQQQQPSATSAPSSARRSKELLTSANDEMHAQDKGLADVNYHLELPRPVEVSSKVLFVARAPLDDDNGRLSAASSERQHRALTSAGSSGGDPPPVWLPSTAVPSARPVQTDGAGHRSSPPLPATAAELERPPASRAGAGQNEIETNRADEEQDERNAPRNSINQPAVVMTNNHRIGSTQSLPPALARHHAPTTAATTTTTSTTTTETNANKQQSNGVDRRSHSPVIIDRNESTATSDPLQRFDGSGNNSGPVQVRSRSGRMRQIPSSSAPAAQPTASEAAARMGDSAAAESALEMVTMDPLDTRRRDSDESSNNNSDAAVELPDKHQAGLPPGASPTLAQNITGALIRWSLKTLGKLAQKSLESLVDERNFPALAANLSTPTSDNLASGGLAPAPQDAGHIRDGFLVDGPVASTTARDKPAAGHRQQPMKAATQSADLLQSSGPHHVEAPPLGQPGPSSRAATTVALTPPAQHGHSTTASLQTTPPPATTSTSTTTRAPETGVQQRQHKPPPPAHASQHKWSAQQPARSKTPAGQNDEPSSLPKANKSQAGAPAWPLWPVYTLWGAMGAAVLIMLVIYYVAFVRSSPYTFEPTTIGRHYTGDHLAATRRPPYKQQQQPGASWGVLTRLSDAICRQLGHAPPASDPRRTGGSRIDDVLPASVLCQPTACKQQQQQRQQQQQQQQVDTISRLLPAADRDVRSPSVQRRRRQPPDQSQEEGPPSGGRTSNAPRPAPTSPGASESGSLATRSTSAASTANYSTRAGSSFSDQHENYCKNHEQFVYSDYLLLSSSDCLSKDWIGRESFA
jgi:hypothetical protein